MSQSHFRSDGAIDISQLVNRDLIKAVIPLDSRFSFFLRFTSEIFELEAQKIPELPKQQSSNRNDGKFVPFPDHCLSSSVISRAKSSSFEKYCVVLKLIWRKYQNTSLCYLVIKEFARHRYKE